MNIELKTWMIGMAGGGLFLLCMLLVFPYIAPNAPDQLIRALVLRSGVGVARVMLLTWGLRYLDNATDGAFAKSIAENPYAAAAVYIALIWAVVTGSSVP